MEIFTNISFLVVELGELLWAGHTHLLSWVGWGEYRLLGERSRLSQRGENKNEQTFQILALSFSCFFILLSMLKKSQYSLALKSLFYKCLKLEQEIKHSQTLASQKRG